MRKSAAVTMDDLLAYGCDHVRVSNADKRMRQRKVLLKAAAARHSQRLLVSCPPERDAYVEELAAYFRPPRDLVDMKQWWGYFMNRRGVPRILYLILAHFRFADIRLAFMRHLILRQSDFSLEDVLEAAADARRVYAETRSSSETLIVAMAFEGSSAMRGTGPHRVTRDFIRRVYAETPLTRRVHAHLKQLHLATPTALSTIVTELQHLLTGLDDAGDLTYTHMGLIRAVLYGSGNEWFYHPSLGGNHVDDYPMAALLAGVGEDHLLVGALRRGDDAAETRESSPAVFCSTLRCEARFSIGRIARKLQNETLCGEDCDRMKPAQKIQARRGFWLGFCKASSAAKIVIAASRAHRDVTFSRQAVTSAPALTSPQNTQSLRCAPFLCGSARTDVDRKHVSGSPFVSC